MYIIIIFSQSRPIENPLFTEIVVEDRFGVFFLIKLMSSVILLINGSQDDKMEDDQMEVRMIKWGVRSGQVDKMEGWMITINK